jgi:hypothetical protein
VTLQIVRKLNYILSRPQPCFQAKFKTTRGSKAPVPAHYIKNKNQIRHFYYRTWHKIAPHIEFAPNIKKSTRELYALVNYGELWKKVGGTLGGKLGSKLNDLVQKGSTALKIKGKTLRVRTPVCRALKELHSRVVGGSGGDVALGGGGGGIRGPAQPKLPAKVVISLRPRHTADWVRVQKFAQNPHLRLTVGLQRRVVSLLRCLTAKWRPPEAKLAAGLGLGEDKVAAVLGTPAATEEQLVILPRKGAKINIPVISAAPVLTSSDIGLQNMPPDDEPAAPGPSSSIPVAAGGAEDGGNVASSSLTQKKPRVRFKFAGPDAVETIIREVEDEEEEEEAAPPLPDSQEEERLTPPRGRKRKFGELLMSEDFLLTEDSEAESSRSPGGPPTDPGSDKESDIENADGGPGSSGVISISNGSGVIKKEENGGEENGVKQEEPVAAASLQRDPTLGWSLQTAGNLTVGELYWMLGEEGSAGFQLDYTWQGSSKAHEQNCQVPVDLTLNYLSEFFPSTMQSLSAPNRYGTVLTNNCQTHGVTNTKICPYRTGKRYRYPVTVKLSYE